MTKRALRFRTISSEIVLAVLTLLPLAAAEVYSPEEWRALFARFGDYSRPATSDERRDLMARIERIVAGPGCDDMVANAKNLATLFLDTDQNVSQQASGVLFAYALLDGARPCLALLKKEVTQGMAAPHPRTIRNLSVPLAVLAASGPLTKEEHEAAQRAFRAAADPPTARDVAIALLLTEKGREWLVGQIESRLLDQPKLKGVAVALESPLFRFS